MKNLVTAVFGLLAVLIVAQASVLTSTNCSISFDNQTKSQANPSSCSVSNGLDTFAIASITKTETLPMAGSPSSPVGNLFTVQQTQAGTPPIAPGSASAQASGADTIVLSTAGPVRQGELAFSEGVGFTQTRFGTVDSSAGISIGPYSTTCTGPSAPYCTGNFGSSSGNDTGTVPFTLGQTFTFSETVSQSALAAGGAPTVGTGSVDFSFTLLEADGTPVQAFVVPEPATLPLVALAFLLLCGARRRRKAIVRATPTPTRR